MVAARRRPAGTSRSAGVTRPARAARRAGSAAGPAAGSAPLNVALVGQGFMGRAHSNAWGQVGRFFEPPRRPVLHTIAGRNKQTLAAFAERWGWAHWTVRWQDLAADPAVQLVDIGTPNDSHAEIAVAMLQAGKHVACEKPLAGTLAQARVMRDAAEEAARRGVQSFVWFNYRRCPAVALAHQLVAEGRIGKLHHVRARYLQSWGGKDTPLSWRFDAARAGSGAHGDLNAHLIDLARFLTGDEFAVIHGATARTFIEQRRRMADSAATLSSASQGSPTSARRGRVEAAARPARRRPAAGKDRSTVDDCVLFLAGMARGAVASFEASRVATGHLNDNSIELNGDRGALRFDFEDMNVLHFFDATEPRRTAGWRRIMVTAAEHPWVSHWWPEAHVLGYEHGFTNMAADICSAVAGGAAAKAVPVPLPGFADGWEVQRVLQAALLSVHHGAAVPLSEIG